MSTEAPSAPGTLVNPPGAPPTAPPTDPGGNTPPARPEYLPEKFWKEDGPDVEGLARSYGELETALRNRKPHDLPADPNGYQLKPETLPEGIAWSDEAAAKFASVFHANGVSPAQARAITDAFIEIEAGNHSALSQAYEKQIAEGTAALKSEWGDQYDAKLGAVKTTVERLGYDPNDASLFANPKVVSFLGKVAGLLSEDALAAAGAKAPGSQFTDAAAEAERIMRDASHPDHKAYHEGDPATVGKVMRLLNGQV